MTGDHHHSLQRRDADDVSTNERERALAYTYNTSNRHLQHIYHEKSLVTTCVTERYLTAPLTYDEA